MNWKYISNADKIGTLGADNAATSFDYSCPENPALRSCTRENTFMSAGENHQVYACPAAVGRATVDVEDLGRCFEDIQHQQQQQQQDRGVNYPAVIQKSLSNGKVVRNVYRGVVIPKVRNVNRNICNYNERADPMRDKVTKQHRQDHYIQIVKNNENAARGGGVSPSERTWVNMKEAFVDYEKDDQRKAIENYQLRRSDDDYSILSSDLNKMANPPSLMSSEMSNSTYFKSKWQPAEFYSPTCNSDGNDQRQIYATGETGNFDQQPHPASASTDVSWFSSTLHEQRKKPHFNIPLSERMYDHRVNHETRYHDDYDRHNSVNNFNQQNQDRRIHESLDNHCNSFRNDYFCTEDQWLRCQATSQCPTLQDNNYNFNSNHLFNTIPCLDQSSKLIFYYGEDIGYLTPAEYLRYEEDSLSNEKRKEKSRDAARCRRSRETDIFSELANELPIPVEQVAHLDKASVMRLAIAYLKVRTVIDAIPEPLAKPEPSTEMDGMFLKALDGFMLVLSSDGDMVYLSENVSEYLGVSQMDLMGQNVYDYSHPCDHEELRECLSMKPSAFNDEKQLCNLFLRLKCTLTSKGRKVNLKSASYKVIHCTGHMVVTPRDLSTPVTESEDNDDNSETNEDSENNEKVEKGTGGCLVLVGCPVPHPSNIEAPLGRFTFLSKHSLNMKFTYADEKLAEYLGWNTNEMVGQSVFEFHHALDNPVLDKSFKSLFGKGQCETPAYRFLGKKGGYVWVVTQATLIHCAKQHRPLSVVCVNYIVSGLECENEVYSARQLEARSVDAAASSEKEISENLPVVASTVSLLATVSILNKDKNNEEDLNLPSKITTDIDVKNQLIVGENISPVTTSAAAAAAAVPIPLLPIVIQERQRPLSVTASLFRTQEKPQREAFASKKILDPQKEVFNKPVSSTSKIFAHKSLPDYNSTKENQPNLLRNENNNSNSANSSSSATSLTQNQTDFIFQGKPVKYFSSEIQRVRPQVVTSSLFSPAPQLLQEPPSRPPPQTTTASIFAPRTKDMNKGFLTFSEDQPGLTMLKDEPEDLTHLAPTPGDVCVPLEDTPFLSDMLDDFLLTNDNYCPLLSPGLPNELRTSDLGDSLKDSDLDESLRNNELGESLADSDPFMYRDSPSSCSGSPDLLSPALSKSPGSMDSLCSPSGSGGGLSEDEMLMLSIGDVLADEELALRAPYIPMSDQDETLQLFISNDMVMWPQPPDKKPKWSNNVNENNSESNNVSSSSLEQLLRNNSSGNIKKCNDHGGGLVDPMDALGNIYKKNIKDENNLTNWNTKSFSLSSSSSSSSPLSTVAIERSQKRLHSTTISNFDNIDNINNKRLKCNIEEEKEEEDKEQEQEREIRRDVLLGNINLNNNNNNNDNKGISNCIRGSGGLPGNNLLNNDDNNIINLNLSLSTRHANSQLLQQLMSQQSPSKNRTDHNNGGTEGGGGGGGGGEGSGGIGNGNCGSENSATTKNNQQQQQQQNQHQQQSNSVLMNLLVSGCDGVIDPRNIPPLLQRKISPLTLNLENQTVPQMPSNIALDHLSPDTRNELVNSLPRVNNKISSPQEMEPMDFDDLDFDVSPLSFELLQGSDLLKIPANNNLV